MKRMTMSVLMLIAIAAATFSMDSFAAEERALLSAPLTQAVGRQLSAETVTYAPGQSTSPHRHGGDIFVYVLSGHIRSQLAGGALHVFGPGESWFEAAGAHHVVSGNASDSEPATMLVVFIASPKAVLTTLDNAEAHASTPARTQSR
ncbi:cupin domain-containing protein [Dyella humi]|uniref:Cupin domain-containing protein n=1 Tax=Dyella humi TaxID=1770547 RepID=A0ABW8IP45_9GAMM